MKKLARLAALLLTLTLALGLFTACGGQQEDDEGEVDTRNIATAGGSISWPEGFALNERFSAGESGGTLYISVNGIQNRASGYFNIAGSSLTVVGQATTESENRKEFRVTLWKETTGAREYVDTLYLKADGSCYTGSFTGLDAGARYKVGLAYDGGSYYLSGGVTVSGLVDEAAQAQKEA